MHSPFVTTLLSTPQSRISITQRSSYGVPGVQNTTPQSVRSELSAKSTLNTIEFYTKTSSFAKYGGYIALFGGFLFQLTLGSWFSFGNLTPYIASYLTASENRAHSHHLSDVELQTIYNDYLSSINIVFFVAMCFNALLSFGGGDIEVRIGPTKTLMISAVLLSFGFGLTYFGLIYHSFALICCTFGVLFGCGVGTGYCVQPIVCMRWFPEKVYCIFTLLGD